MKKNTNFDTLRKIFFKEKNYRFTINNKIKKNSGITIISLIVTIIVLLILAGITISTLTSENGILGRASEATFRNDIVAFQEELDVYILSKTMKNNGIRNRKITANKYTKGGESDSVYTYIKSFKKMYEGKLQIKDDLIIYTGTDSQEKNGFKI